MTCSLLLTTLNEHPFYVPNRNDISILIRSIRASHGQAKSPWQMCLSISGDMIQSDTFAMETWLDRVHFLSRVPVCPFSVLVTWSVFRNATVPPPALLTWHCANGTAHRRPCRRSTAKRRRRAPNWPHRSGPPSCPPRTFDVAQR